MNWYLKKLISFIITILSVAILSFVMFQVIPGNAAIARLGTEATPEAVEALNKEYGYDKSLPVRFVNWLGGAVRGDFGKSMRYETMTVAELIKGRLPVTLTLAGMSVILIILIAIPLGILTTRDPGGTADRITDGSMVAVMAIPSFVQGILITFVFGIVLKMFVPGGYVDPSKNLSGFIGFMLFPAISVALPKVAMTVRFMKTRVKAELGKDYVRTARAKGNTTRRVMWGHVFKNSLMPVITFVGLIVAEVMAGSIMIEQVFNLPGMGRLLVTSIANRDFNVVQAIVIYIATAVIFVNMIVDILYKIVDPRNIT
ncbi:MAG: ABC transporter permease [Lachnospiraceae bacterium]|nr:ABC transporter permease [Lachnospiraceae bacterium]MCR5768877.1 ABC transporter permease [Lachnospiraceae bacterium]